MSRKSLLHWSALAVSAICWLLAAWGSRREDAGRKPEHIAATAAADIAARVRDAAAIERHQAELLQWIDGNTRYGGDDSTWVYTLRYGLFAMHGDSLIAWSTAALLPPAQMNDSGRLYRLNNGTYYGYRIRRAWLPAEVTLALLFPVTRQYPFNNEYLQPGFASSPRIDPHVVIADTPVKGAVALHAPDGRTVGWVHPPPPDDLPETPADWIVWCWLLSLAAFAAWLHGWTAAVRRRAGAGWSIATVLVAAVLMRGMIAIFGPPFRISESVLFSPTLYASSAWLPSLGALLLHLLAALWIAFVAAPPFRRLPFRLPTAMRRAAGLLLSSALAVAYVVSIRLVRSLVLDSLIPFDTAHLSSLYGPSLAGLVIASLLLTLLIVIAGGAGKALRAMLPSPWLQGAVLTAGAVIVWATMLRENISLPIYGIAAGWMLTNTLGPAASRLREGGSGLRGVNIIWSVGHCLLLALLIQHFGRIREGETRRHFAEHIASRHDDAMEYNFGQSLTLIRTDTALLHFYQRPSAAARKALEEHLASLYFNGALSAYQAQVYLYNAAGKPLMNRDTGTLTGLQRISEASVPSRTASDLFYREAATDDHIYLALLPVEDSAGALLGTIGIDLEQKKIVSETVLPELLQPATTNQAEKAAGYSYAIYAGGRLVAQTSDYPFPFYIRRDTTRRVYFERRGADFSTLIYTPDAYRSVYVWRRFGTLSEVLTLFAYLLLMRLLLLALGSAIGGLRHWPVLSAEGFRGLRGIGLRQRVQWSIMGIVTITAIGIGVATILFLKRQYDNSGKTQRQAMMQTVARAIQQWMRERDADDAPTRWGSAMAAPDFRYFLSGLAAAQKVDINLFNADGRLAFATQPAIYDGGLLAPIMRHDALRSFYGQSRAMLTQIEHIGTLRYQSCYAPLRAEGGDVAAYLNVPLFYAQRELDEQISSVVVTLINLYVAALLLSGLLAYFITRWVTRAFDLIIRQFGRLSLHQNELLQWPYDDELGLLVAAYNKMVRKVEESVAMLARNEREGAFREMARQVAHEIKNPLTPMSLYVQRLQRALQAGEPDALALAKRVSEALLEQINNLSVIATEFGDFARIGAAKPEPTELTEVLRNVVAPFAADGAMDVTYELPSTTVIVLADRSGLVRIITNLMRNATQAIPEGRRGRIYVQLLREADHVVLRVQDNGSGISPEAREKLFTPYFTTKSSGTGIGLAMTRQMVEAWGGGISYDTAPGAGTTFSIRLPVYNAPGQ